MMKNDEKTIYLNGAPEEEKEKTIYIQNDRIEFINDKEFEAESGTVYIGKEGIADSTTTSVVDNDEEADNAKLEEDIINISVNVQKSNEETPQYFLPTNTILQKRYRINYVIGEGGFGITYSGWDVTLNIPVAIKEYYPSGLVTRSVTLGKTTQVVPVASAKYGTQFRDGMDRVLDEARRMAKFRNTPGIVGIYDFFEANNTAYIVMEYIEGVTLDNYCKENRIDNTTLFNMLVPVMDALQALHDEGIIHRDISPDNIMVDRDGNFKLLDFGAARGFSEENSTTMSVILKKSYAPEEQFRTKGNQGPWTDVYALGATIYEQITGQTPPTSIDRLVEDEIIDIRDCISSLTKGQAEAIMTALAVRQKDRWQSMNEFKIALIQMANNKAKDDKELNEIASFVSISSRTKETKKNIDLVIDLIKQNRKTSRNILIMVIVLVCIFVFVNRGYNDVAQVDENKIVENVMNDNDAIKIVLPDEEHTHGIVKDNKDETNEKLQNISSKGYIVLDDKITVSRRTVKTSSGTYYIDNASILEENARGYEIGFKIKTVYDGGETTPLLVAECLDKDGFEVKKLRFKPTKEEGGIIAETVDLIPKETVLIQIEE